MKSTLVMMLTLLLSFEASGKPPKMSTDLSQVDRNANVRVIVQYVRQPGDVDHQRLLNRGGKLRRKMNSLRARAYDLPASALSDLANDPNIAYVSIDHKIKAKLDYSTKAINAESAWLSSFKGTGVGVAVVDSGITPVADLGGQTNRIVYTQDFVGGDGRDQYGHGEHIAGIIAANGAASQCSGCNRNLTGVAPDANLVDLRVLDANGEGSDSAVIAAIETAISLKDQYNIRVINLSLGRQVFESYTLDPLCQAVEAAWKAGIVVVVAAGNEGRDNSMGTNGYGTIGAPGNDPYVITVGAMKAMATYDRTDDLIASYSSKGPSFGDFVVKPDLVAPGNQVVSLLAPGATLLQYPADQVPVSYYQNTSTPEAGSAISNSYLMLNGTSMAAAVVSGAVADLLQAEPNLTPDQVKARLMKTAYKTFPKSSVATDPVTGQTFTSQYDIFTVGAGYLDLQAALANKDLAAGSALSPTARLDPASGNIYLVFDPSSTWSGKATGQPVGLGQQWCLGNGCGRRQQRGLG